MRQSRDTFSASPLAWGALPRVGVAAAAAAGLWLSVGWALGWW
ncbi:MAG: hypothetical protein M0006_03640 [Magnetospirillum sp.]|nr:hypothetical protein [Magnetospirillum sp.]